MAANEQPVPKGKSVELIDGNVYNCHPDNLRIKEKRGRPMICVDCGRRTTKETSERIKVGDRYQRHCHQCLREWADWEEE